VLKNIYKLTVDLIEYEAISGLIIIIHILFVSFDISYL
jgi:hypothetical protein